MTFPGKNDRRVKLWEKDVESRVGMQDKQKWMDRFVDWHLDILSKQPIDILANVSWLPASMADDYESYWTLERVKKVVDAAVEYRVALEISSSYKLPKPSFLKAAKAGGAKFSFGSNGRYPNMGKLDYSVEMAKALHLTQSDMFTPVPEGRKPFSGGNTKALVSSLFTGDQFFANRAALLQKLLFQQSAILVLGKRARTP